MDWLSIIPPILAIVIAIWKREVILALTVAIFSAEILLANFNPASAFINAIQRVAAVFSSSSNTEILLFSLLIGALLSLVRNSGGLSAFVRYILNKGLARGPRSVSLLTTLLGIIIFIESNLSVLASGIFAQSLFDRFNMSRARLAFIVDSTCAPVSVLILLNAWGAYILGLLNGYGLDNPVSIMVKSIPLNFYAISILLFVFYTAWTNKTHFSLAAHEENIQQLTSAVKEKQKGKVRFFLLPLLTLILSIIGFMFFTGNGNIIEGSGSSSVLYATLLSILVTFALLRADKRFTHKELIQHSFQGMSELLPLVSIVLLALALGSVMQDLGTGNFIASMISEALPLWLIAPTVFLAAAITSFTTGTSWGTFGILIPVAIPLALTTGLSPSLLLAAVLGGGVFGDHCSPISDSTVLSSLAAGCDHLEHVKTQLPYALLAGGIALILFSLFSIID